MIYEKGYNGTTVDDIIELSGTSKGSFYYYFNTKDELLNTLSMILDDFYEELEDGIRNIVVTRLDRDLTVADYENGLPFSIDHYAP